MSASPATYADLEALAPNMVGQIIFGVLHAHPRPDVLWLPDEDAGAA